MPASSAWISLIPFLLLGALLTALLLPLRRLTGWRRTIFVLWAATLSGWYALVVLGVPSPVAPGTETLTDPQRVALSVTVLLATWAVVRLFDLLVWDVLLSRRAQRAVPRLLVNLVHVLVFSLVLLLILSQVFEKPVTGLLVTSTVVSAVIGLALQDVLKNVIDGLALQFDAPFQLGDWIAVGAHEGQVQQLNWRTLTLETVTRNHITLPNSEVASERLVNFSRPDPLQGIDAFIAVGESYPPGVVKALLADAAAEAEGVSPTPRPTAYLVDFGDASINYRIRFWVVDHSRIPKIQDAVLTNAWYRLRRAGIDLPTAARDVRLRTVQPDDDQRARQAELQAIRAILRELALFAPLSDAQIAQVASGAELEGYTAGEVLVHQGQPGDSLYIIRSGHVRVDAAGEDGQAVTIARRSPGEFFGEMSLLTGAVRSASVTAEAETEVVSVGKLAVAEVLLADPEIAEGLAEALALRLDETERRLAEEHARQIEEPHASLPKQLLSRIRAFFGLASAPETSPAAES